MSATFSPRSHELYQGQCYADGTGKLVPHGLGVVHHDIWSYAGVWVHGERHGSGRLDIYDGWSCASAHWYVGQFAHNERCGYGEAVDVESSGDVVRRGLWHRVLVDVGVPATLVQNAVDDGDARASVASALAAPRRVKECVMVPRALPKPKYNPRWESDDAIAKLPRSLSRVRYKTLEFLCRVLPEENLSATTCQIYVRHVLRLLDGSYRSEGLFFPSDDSLVDDMVHHEWENPKLKSGAPHAGLQVLVRRNVAWRAFLNDTP
jgi:hypothetical protein